MWHILQNIFSSDSFFYISTFSTNVNRLQHLLNVKKIHCSRNILKCQNFIMIYNWKSIAARINHRIYIKKREIILLYWIMLLNVINTTLIKHDILLLKKKKKKKETAWDFKSTISQPLNIIDALGKLHRRIFDDV